MTKSKKYLSILLMLLLCNTSSCDFNFDKDVKGIKVPEMLWYIADEYGIDYCELLEKAMDGNFKALNQFIRLEIFDADYIGQHSTVVLQLIRKKGERYIIKTLGDWGYSPHSKQELLKYLDWAIYYENGCYGHQHDTKNDFPILYEWLTDDETGIVVPDVLRDIAECYYVDYDALLISALNGDYRALDQFIFLKIYQDDFKSKHSTVVLQIIEKKGGNFIIETLNTYSPDDKKQLLEYLDKAIQYEHGRNDNRANTKTKFPLLYEWLTSDETLGDS